MNKILAISNSTFNISDMSSSTIQTILDILTNPQNDISNCLKNCSNQGQCQLNPATEQLVCQCFTNFNGPSCQTDLRPCSQNKCFNNGTCININNMTSFKCECQSNLYYGTNCENKVNICINVTCSGQGYCLDNGTVPVCKCYMGYFGDRCEQQDSSKKIVSKIQITSIIIVCAVFSFTVFIILANDGWNLLLASRKRERIVSSKPSSKETIVRFKYYTATEILPPLKYQN